MKKALVLILTLVLCLGLMAGCGGTTTTTSTTATDTSTSTGTATTSTSSGDVYNLVYAHTNSEESSGHEVGLLIQQRLEELTPGRFTMTIYPNGQLGADREDIEGVQNGDITMTNSSTAPQANFVTAVEVLDLPFIFTDVEMAREICRNEDFLSVMRDAYAEKGIYLMALMDQGFRTTTTDTLEAHTPDDFNGFNIRPMENANHLAIWKALGANPTPIAYTELYTALQQGTVRGQENPYENISVKKFYEQQDYIIGTNHVLQVIAWIANLDWYNALDADCKAAFDQVVGEAHDFSDNYMNEHQAAYVKEFEDYGCTVYDLTPDELAQFQEKTQSVYATIEQHMKDIDSPAYDTLMQVVADYAG